MLSQLWSAALFGLEAYPVRVEADVGPGLAGFSTVGLPDAAVRESKERVIAAIRNTGLEFPLRRITVNLAPADRRKEGSAFDLPIAIGILAASGQLPPASIQDHVMLGELSLDGALRPLRGALALAHAAREGPAPRSLLMPRRAASEASLCEGVTACGVDTLGDAVAILRGERAATPEPPPPPFAGARAEVDLAEVRGQAHARRALELAAAGGHNLLMVGPPGAGKTLLARALPGILPAFAPGEALEPTRIHSVAGVLPPGAGLLDRRPFRAPHHTISGAGLVGGGRIPRPGEISLAHGGVLFLDELTEFPPHTLELLRQPLEEGRVAISRAAAHLEFPARFMFVAAANPCACGHLGDDPRKPCRCTPAQLASYQGRVSGPILDRIDLEVTVPRVPLSELTEKPGGEPSAAVRARVEAARALQAARWNGSGARTNADAKPAELIARGEFTSLALILAARCAEKFALSARGYYRMLRVARTAADLAASREVRGEHVAEAAGVRRAQAAG